MTEGSKGRREGTGFRGKGGREGGKKPQPENSNEVYLVFIYICIYILCILQECYLMHNVHMYMYIRII